jgi:antitoxin component of MazEF toxin-antitoxin module
MGETFNTTVMKAEGKNATGLSIPPEVIAALGKSKKPSVKVSLNGYTYRSTVAVMGNEFLIPLNAAHREAAGLQAGDPIEVTLELDLEPRTVEIPDDLKAALSARVGALEAYEASAYSKRKEFVRQVEDAKTQETRERRISGIVDKLSGS